MDNKLRREAFLHMLDYYASFCPYILLSKKREPLEVCALCDAGSKLYEQFILSLEAEFNDPNAKHRNTIGTALFPEYDESHALVMDGLEASGLIQTSERMNQPAFKVFNLEQAKAKQAKRRTKLGAKEIMAAAKRLQEYVDAMTNDQSVIDMLIKQ